MLRPPLCMSVADQSNNLYNYQEYYQQHQKQQKQQHYQLQQQQQELHHYGSYTAPGGGIPSSSLSQLTLPLTRSLYHSSVVSPLETSFMPVHTHNSTGRQQHSTHHQHHQFFTSNLHPQHRSEENRGGGGGGGGGGGENNSSGNSPPLSLVHGNSDLELSSYALDHQLQLQQSSRRSSSNQQLQQHGGRRNERRKYTRKQHGDRSSERKSKHRRSGESRVRGGDSGIVSDTSDVLAAICSGALIPISGATTPTLAMTRRSTAGDTTADTLIFNQYRQFLGIPESYKISYPHYYEDAINPCPSDYPESDPATNRYASSGLVIENSTPPSTLANNLPPSDPPNIHYSELGNQVKNTTKSKRSASSYTRTSEEQAIGVTPPMTVGSTATTTTTTVTPAANSITTTAANVNGSSSSSSATTLSVTSSNPTGAHYPELHFRDVGREIDV